MSVSSVPASTPVTPPAVSQPQAPNVKNDGSADTPSRAQPTVAAPLPPGQGTRVDQIA
jgi:hypothetical protein